MGSATSHYPIVWVLSLMLIIGFSEANPQIKAKSKHRSHAECLDPKYRKCYKSVHICPKICHNHCAVDCRSCKPICIHGGSTASPPQAHGGSPIPATTVPPEPPEGMVPSLPPSSPPLKPPAPALASVPSPDSTQDSFPPPSPPPPPPPQEADLYAPPPPRAYIPPDNYPRNGMRWCRDRNYSCYGTVMTCYPQYCPLDQCTMDCAACELTCNRPSPPNTASTPPPPQTPSPPDPYQNDDFWSPARPVYPDDFPVMGTRWCRDIGSDCFGDSMVCDSRYCPLDQCFMDCNYCALGCRVSLLIQPPETSPTGPPVSTTPPPVST